MSSYDIFRNQQSLLAVATARAKEWAGVSNFAWVHRRLGINLVASALLPSLQDLSDRMHDGMTASL